MDKIIKDDFDSLDSGVKFNFISLNESSRHDNRSTKELYARASDMSSSSSQSSTREQGLQPTQDLHTLVVSSKLISQG